MKAWVSYILIVGAVLLLGIVLTVMFDDAIASLLRR